MTTASARLGRRVPTLAAFGAALAAWAGAFRADTLPAGAFFAVTLADGSTLGRDLNNIAGLGVDGSAGTATIADLLDKPALKAIFAKHLPGLANNERINEGRALTLANLVQYVPEQVTPEKLAAIDAELKVLPPQ